MKYYSLQNLKAWEKAKEIGFLVGNEKYIDKDWFGTSYKWLMEQMKKRIHNYDGEYPIWLWLTTKNIYIDFSTQEEWVLLEIELPENQVLYSSFDAWHIVLNDCHFDEENKNIRKEESWEYIFDKDKLKKFGFDFELEDLQATTGKINCKNIKVLKYILNERIPLL